MLCDVHTALELQALDASNEGAERIFVQGSYEYHHYGQGTVSDHGWGCAYRSCQTIFSWYKLQSPAVVQCVPTIEDMQKTLVQIGDKPASFIHSHEWIGSVEISLLLDAVCDVSCKIVNIPNDRGLDREVSRQLAEHLSTVGSPIMVGGQGGGARTIIGLELSTEGDVLRFLVLDPHYSGQDSLESLRQQISRVCVWVSPRSLCRQYGKFTNLCLPLLGSASAHGCRESGCSDGGKGMAATCLGADEWLFEVVECSE